MNLLAAIFSITLATDDKVLLIGDSLAYMLAPYLKKELPGQFVSSAKGGTTLAQWQGQHWAEQAIKKHKPTILLISLGTNDRVPINQEKFADRAAKLNAYAESQGIRPIWLLPPEMPFSVKFVYDGLDSFETISFFDAAKEKDKIHLVYWANEEWANIISSYLRFGS